MSEATSKLASLRLLLVLLFCLLLAACADSVELHSGLSERDANEIIATLLSNGIHGRKASNKQGFIISVGETDLAAAVALLHEHGLPRNAFARMGEIFKKDGMISTPVEERARYLSALSQELENTLSQIDGVVLARVHPVLPERIVPGEPVQPSSCAVLIKYRPGWEPDAYEERIRKLILASIPGLAGSSGSASMKVSVIFVPATPAVSGVVEPYADAAQPAASARALRKKKGLENYWLVALVISVLVAAGAALGWYYLRDHLRDWRNKQRKVGAYDAT